MSDECDLHELANCAICNGAAARFERSVAFSGLDDRPSAGVKPHGPKIEAVFNGHCANCGRAYDAGTEIAHDNVQGWVASCCA